MGPPGVGQDGRAQPAGVIGAQRAGGHRGQGLVDQRLVPGRLGGLGGRAPGPDRLADEPGAVRAAAVGEPADGRDDPGRIAAEHGHVGERHRLAGLAQGAADQVPAFGREPRRARVPRRSPPGARTSTLPWRTRRGLGRTTRHEQKSRPAGGPLPSSSDHHILLSAPTQATVSIPPGRPVSPALPRSPAAGRGHRRRPGRERARMGSPRPAGCGRGFGAGSGSMPVITLAVRIWPFRAPASRAGGGSLVGSWAGGRSVSQSVEVVLENLGPGRVAQLGHRLGLDLADPLPGDPVGLADLIQASWAARRSARTAGTPRRPRVRAGCRAPRAAALAAG